MKFLLTSFLAIKCIRASESDERETRAISNADRAASRSRKSSTESAGDVSSDTEKNEPNEFGKGNDPFERTISTNHLNGKKYQDGLFMANKPKRKNDQIKQIDITPKLTFDPPKDKISDEIDKMMAEEIEKIILLVKNRRHSEDIRAEAIATLNSFKAMTTNSGEIETIDIFITRVAGCTTRDGIVEYMGHAFNKIRPNFKLIRLAFNGDIAILTNYIPVPSDDPKYNGVNKNIYEIKTANRSNYNRNSQCNTPQSDSFDHGDSNFNDYQQMDANAFKTIKSYASRVLSSNTWPAENRPIYSNEALRFSHRTVIPNIPPESAIIPNVPEIMPNRPESRVLGIVPLRVPLQPIKIASQEVTSSISMSANANPPTSANDPDQTTLSDDEVQRVKDLSVIMQSIVGSHINELDKANTYTKASLSQPIDKGTMSVILDIINDNKKHSPELKAFIEKVSPLDREDYRDLLWEDLKQASKNLLLALMPKSQAKIITNSRNADILKGIVDSMKKSNEERSRQIDAARMARKDSDEFTPVCEMEQNKGDTNQKMKRQMLKSIYNLAFHHSSNLDRKKNMIIDKLDALADSSLCSDEEKIQLNNIIVTLPEFEGNSNDLASMLEREFVTIDKDFQNPYSQPGSQGNSGSNRQQPTDESEENRFVHYEELGTNLTAIEQLKLVNCLFYVYSRRVNIAEELENKVIPKLGEIYSKAKVNADKNGNINDAKYEMIVVVKDLVENLKKRFSESEFLMSNDVKKLCKRLIPLAWSGTLDGIAELEFCIECFKDLAKSIRVTTFSDMRFKFHIEYYKTPITVIIVDRSAKSLVKTFIKPNEEAKPNEDAMEEEGDIDYCTIRGYKNRIDDKMVMHIMPKCKVLPHPKKKNALGCIFYSDNSSLSIQSTFYFNE